MKQKVNIDEIVSIIDHVGPSYFTEVGAFKVNDFIMTEDDKLEVGALWQRILKRYVSDDEIEELFVSEQAAIAYSSHADYETKLETEVFRALLEGGVRPFLAIPNSRLSLSNIFIFSYEEPDENGNVECTGTPHLRFDVRTKGLLCRVIFMLKHKIENGVYISDRDYRHSKSPGISIGLPSEETVKAWRKLTTSAVSDWLDHGEWQ